MKSGKPASARQGRNAKPGVLIASGIAQPRPVSPTLKGYLPTLDGWRAFAVMGVVVCHLSYHMQGQRHILLILFNGLGQKGVEVFFSLSGLLITSRLLEERRANGYFSLKRFYVRRLLRILPPAFMYLAVIAVLGAMGVIATSEKGILASLFFVRNYVPADWFTGHFWSLAVEEHFYLLWPGMLFLFGVRRSWWTALGIVAAVTAWRAWLWIPLGHVIGFPWFYFHTDTRLDSLLCGAILAILLESQAERLRPWLRPVVVIPTLGALFVLLIGVPGPLNSLARLGQAIIISLVLTSTLLHPQTWISRVLEFPQLRFIGRISYSLYLWQEFFLAFEIRFWALELCGAFALACASYYWIERPAIRLGHALAPPVTPGRSDLQKDRVEAEALEPAVAVAGAAYLK